MELQEKKQKMQPEYRGGRVVVCMWRVQGREMQNWNRFPIWAVIPFQSCYNLCPCSRDSEPLHRWQPDFGAPCSHTTQTWTATGRETKHSWSHSPFLYWGCHKSAPSTPHNPTCKFLLGKRRACCYSSHHSNLCSAITLVPALTETITA